METPPGPSTAPTQQSWNSYLNCLMLFFWKQWVKDLQQIILKITLGPYSACF